MMTLASAQDLSRVVSYQSQGATINSILTTLQKESGVVLSTTPATGRDVVFIDVKNVPLSTLLEKLSLTVGAEWSREAGGFRLVRSAALEQRQAAEDRQITAARLRAAIAKAAVEGKLSEPFDSNSLIKGMQELRSQIEKMRAEGSAGASITMPRTLGPDSRAALKLLQLIPPDSLALTRTGERHVFATNPTAMQKGLASVAPQVARQAIQEQIAMLKAVQGSIPMPPQGQRGRQDQTPQQSPAERLQSAVIGKIYVVVTRPSRLTYLIQARITDTSGADLMGGVTTLTLDQLIGAPPVQEWPAAPSQVLFSSLTLELSKFMTARRSIAQVNAGSVQGVTPPSAELVEALSNPLAFEPLATVPGEGLKALQAEKKTNTIILLPDEALDTLNKLVLGGPVKTDAFYATLQKEVGLKFEERDGWWTGRPLEWAMSFDSRVDRVQLQGMLSILANGVPSVEQLSAYAMSAPRSRGSGLDSLYAQWVTGATGAAAINNAKGFNREAYIVYGKLGGTQRQSLLNGQPISIAQAAIVRDDLFSLVFHSSDGPQRQTQGQNRGRDNERQVQISSRIQVMAAEMPILGSLQSGGLQFFGGGAERTDYLAYGVPQDGRLRMQGNRVRSLRLKNSKTGASLVLDINSYAAMKAAADSGRGGRGNGMQDITQYDLFQEVTQTMITLTLEMNPPSTMSRSLVDVQPVANTQFGGFEALSPDLREQYQKLYDQAFLNMTRSTDRTTGNGRRTPPP